MMAAFTVVLLLLLLFAGVPVALALIGSSLAAVFIFASDLAPSIPLSMMSTASNYLLLAIPLFIMAGEVAIRGRLIEPLVELTRALLAPVPGGTGAATVLTCMFFYFFPNITIIFINTILCTIKFASIFYINT